MAAFTAQWFQAFLPKPLAVNHSTRLRNVIGAFIGIGLTALLCHMWGLQTHAAVWLMAPIGASAVLVFAVPSSPLAQPWPVIGGNTLSALCGILCVHLIPDPVLATAAGVALAIGVMFYARCLHPPGGAAALLAVLTQADWSWALFPALTNSTLLVLAGIAYNNLTRHSYPHIAIAPAPQTTGLSRFKDSDIDAVMARFNEVIDISRDDLRAILQLTELQAYRRQMGEMLCRDIMTENPVSVVFGTELNEAWALMKKHDIKALPVLDPQRRVLGMVTLADFMRHSGADRFEDIGGKLKALVKRTDSPYSDKPEVAGQIMQTDIKTASEADHVVELSPLFSENDLRHVPVVDATRRLVGIITQSDLMRALYHQAA
jgi:CBS domain-containing membrane protein